MTMGIPDTVGPKVVSDFREQQLPFWRIARARDTAALLTWIAVPGATIPAAIAGASPKRMDVG
jgi:hypothetical protein